MTIELEDKIVSSDVNKAFSQAEYGMRWLNVYDKSYVNQTISFQMLGLGSVYTDPEAYTEFWRAPDDVDVIGVIVDLWGVDQMGINSVKGDASAGAYVPGNATSLNFKLEVRGNFRVLDEQEGYPQIYKSTEFFLVKDIDISFDDDDIVVPELNTSSVSPNALTAFGSQVWSGDNGPIRKVFFPLDKDEVLLSFLRGAQYIFTLSASSPIVPETPGNTAVEVEEVHDITMLCASFVCRHTTRRYS